MNADYAEPDILAVGAVVACHGIFAVRFGSLEEPLPTDSTTLYSPVDEYTMATVTCFTYSSFSMPRVAATI
jgi:hypothetical protein